MEPYPKDAITLENVLALIDQLSPSEQEQMRCTLNNKTWGELWDAIARKYAKEGKAMPSLTEEDLHREFRIYRNEQKRHRNRDGSSQLD